MTGYGVTRLRVGSIAVLLVIAGLVVYFPVCGCSYIWDDPEYVVNNLTLRTAEGLWRIWTEPGATPQYYPLVFSGFWIEFYLWGLSPFGYHLVNVLLHGLSAALLWVLLIRLAVPGAWFAASLFLLHPINVESVAWITERKNVLSGLFYIAAASAYLRYALPRCFPSEVGRVSWRWYAASLVLFVCALLSKTVTCTLPVAMFLVLWWKQGKVRLRSLCPLVPFVALGALFGAMTIWMEKYHVGARGDEWVLSFGGRLLLAGRIPWFYVATVVWPCRLSFIYPRWDVDTAVRWQYLFPAGIVAVIVLLWLFRKRIGRGALAGVLFYLVTLFPALGFFNVYPMRFSFVADHFSYLADIGIFALAGATVQSLSSRCGSRCRVPVLAGAWVLIALCAFLTRERIRAYGNAETLWRDTLGKNREAWIAHNNLGEILVARGNIDEAVYHLSAALDLKPDIPEAHGNLANAFFKKGRYNEAVGQYRDMLELDPTNARAWHNMGFVLESVGRGDEAVIAYEEAIQLNPAYAEAYVRLAALLEKRGDSGRATGMYEKALELRPRWGKAMEGLRRLRGVSNGTRATGQGVSAGGGAL